MMLTRRKKRRSGRCAWSAAGLILAFLAAAPVLAEGPPRDPGKAVPQEAQPRETVFSLTVKGGWLMIPIGLCSIIVLTWTIERTISLRRSRLGSPGLVEKLFAVLPPRGRATKENVAEALAVCDASGTMVARVLRTGVEKIHRDEAHAQSFLEESVAKEVHRLKWNLRPFEICIAVAPLLGLLGTIFGMISCFERTTYADTAARAETLANGIYVALVTTAAGLCVAAIAIIADRLIQTAARRLADKRGVRTGES